MKLRCAILDDYQNAALDLADWSSLQDKVELTVFTEHMSHEDEVAEAIRDYDIVVIMRERTPFPKSLFARLPRLKLLVTTGMRNASIDLAAAASHGVVVCGTAGKPEPTTELTWALILGLARHIPQEYNALRTNGPWQITIGADLGGKRLGLLGLGKIGSRVARIGQAFGMEVAAWSQNLTQERAEECGVRLAGSKEELLETSDFVSVHLVLSERTRGLIGAGELCRMKPTSYLINTSRAHIVDQQALIEALQNRWIAGAGVDVYDIEPLPKDHMFRTLPHVLTTPHLGYVSEGNYRIFYRDAVEDIHAFLNGSPIRTLQ
ncbi:D-2-hydroxyacid dehydrogenase family protein [Paenibacillus sp. OAS669]|uniref:D-2-hydroxyacid dehydrogenase family protein n=1 Tax=Paenibacillus sp. OAS669 TaxID=2663821 RepID=UPI001789234E|nr:D-2-hydroxyacid dehydrogenase family protein [Paenibacillus sp. OAS669]MBE1445483.1 phosphoglycerate dehydrogenase-like enzyme [Paenibacillus sp. OAS669]